MYHIIYTSILVIPACILDPGLFGTRLLVKVLPSISIYNIYWSTLLRFMAAFKRFLQSQNLSGKCTCPICCGLSDGRLFTAFHLTGKGKGEGKVCVGFFVFNRRHGFLFAEQRGYVVESCRVTWESFLHSARRKPWRPGWWQTDWWCLWDCSDTSAPCCCFYAQVRIWSKVWLL